MGWFRNVPETTRANNTVAVLLSLRTTTPSSTVPTPTETFLHDERRDPPTSYSSVLSAVFTTLIILKARVSSLPSSWDSFGSSDITVS